MTELRTPERAAQSAAIDDRREDQCPDCGGYGYRSAADGRTVQTCGGCRGQGAVPGLGLALLADALEDAGDARAAGLRLVGGLVPEFAPDEDGGLWRWWFCRQTIAAKTVFAAILLAEEVFERLEGGTAGGHWDDCRFRGYASRSGAYLALATSLMPEAAHV